MSRFSVSTPQYQLSNNASVLSSTNPGIRSFTINKHSNFVVNKPTAKNHGLRGDAPGSTGLSQPLNYQQYGARPQCNLHNTMAISSGTPNPGFDGLNSFERLTNYSATSTFYPSAASHSNRPDGSTALGQNMAICQCGASETVLAEVRNILTEFRVALFKSGGSPPRTYLPHPTYCLPYLNTSDFPWLFSHEDILELVKQRPIVVIDEFQIKSRTLEAEIAGATERIEFQPDTFQEVLVRGSLMRIQPAFPDIRYNDHVLVVLYTHWMDTSVAFVRVVGYHVVTGHRVQPCDNLYGTYIFVIPSPYCDVTFPRTLSEFALKATDNQPDLHYNIRKNALPY